MFIFDENLTLAQPIQHDDTLGTESSVINSNIMINDISSVLIEGGAKRGVNLFHSFEKFNVDEGKGVYFNNPLGIERIFSRVTGKSRSEILGKLGVWDKTKSVLGNADLFLINPNGIIFGSKASLDLNGSFLATTANNVSFADGTQFSSTEPSSSSLLTVSIPIGLQFRATSGETKAADIIVSSASLKVQPSETIALIGGNIFIQGKEGAETGIFAPEGRIELGSVAKGQVSLKSTEQGLLINYDGIQDFLDIQLLQKASISTENFEISTEDERGGNIQVQGRYVTLADGSGVFGIVSEKLGGTLNISASDSVELINSNLGNDTVGAGNGGNIIINTKKLILRERANISTASSGMEMPTGEFVPATGQAGEITLNISQYIDISDDSLITTQAQGFGDAGTLRVNTRQLLVREDSRISAITSAQGRGGNIFISTEHLDVRDGGEISVAAIRESTGQAGNLNINASSVRLGNFGTLSAETQAGQGNILLQVNNDLVLRNHSKITTNATGEASGGNIIINTGTLAAFENSDITANAFFGSGGKIEISAEGIFGLVPRSREEIQKLLGTNDLNLLNPQLLPSSDITAISQTNPSLSGFITIITPEIDPNRGLIQLPQTVVNPFALIAQNPCKKGSKSELAVTGRGGLPPSIDNELNSNATQVDLVEPVPTESRPIENKNIINPLSQPLEPAQGWIFNEKGEVVLTAYNPNVTESQRLPEKSVTCPAP